MIRACSLSWKENDLGQSEKTLTVVFVLRAVVENNHLIFSCVISSGWWWEDKEDPDPHHWHAAPVLWVKYLIYCVVSTFFFKQFIRHCTCSITKYCLYYPSMQKVHDLCLWVVGNHSGKCRKSQNNINKIPRNSWWPSRCKTEAAVAQWRVVVFTNCPTCIFFKMLCIYSKWEQE